MGHETLPIRPKNTSEKIKVEGHQWVKGYENLRGSNIHKTFFSKKSVK